MRIVLVTGLALLLTPATASAGTGYLHMADARKAASAAARHRAPLFGADGYSIGNCARKTPRLVTCDGVYTNVSAGGSDDWTAEIPIDVILRPGKPIRAVSLL